MAWVQIRLNSTDKQAEQISDFSREPESPVIDAATLSAWMEEVDKLRDDVARLNERLDRLERDIWID